MYDVWYEKAVDMEQGRNLIRIKTNNASLTLSVSPDHMHELTFLVANLDNILIDIGESHVEQKNDSDPTGR